MDSRSLFVLLFVSFAPAYSVDLIVNGDFESEIDGTNWICLTCTLERDEYAFAGTHSGMITDRAGNASGITQYINPVPGGSYMFSAKFKLLNRDPDKLWHLVQVYAHERFTSGEEKDSLFSINPHVRQDDGWIEIGGDFTFSTSDHELVWFNIMIPEANINYLIDDVTMTLIEENESWEEEANIRINEIRKNDVTFNLEMDDSIDPDGVKLQFELVKHAFVFGSAVQARLISNSSNIYQPYRDFFFENFNFAVLENDLKWHRMEPVRGQIDYATSEAAIDTLLEKNVPVRGHAISWGWVWFVPSWMWQMTPEEIEAAIADRVSGVVSYFRGRLAHWDVDNENLHHSWFEENTGQHNIMTQTFKDIKKADPSVKSFTNDYNIIDWSGSTVATKQLALKLLNSEAPIYGIGIQAHLSKNLPSVHLLKARLDKVAEAGLPLWITELDAGNADANLTADYYEDIWRLFFSLEAVEGVIMWGFWDQAMWARNASLAVGPNCVPNAAGLRWQKLLFEEWHTNVTLTPSGGLDTRAFNGDYHLSVLYNGEVIQEKNLTVVKGDNVFDIKIGSAASALKPVQLLLYAVVSLSLMLSAFLSYLAVRV